MKWSSIAVLTVTALFSVGRFFIPSHGLSLTGTYEAFAHLFIGGLIGAWIGTRQTWLVWVIAGLSAVELLAFLFKR